MGIAEFPDLGFAIFFLTVTRFVWVMKHRYCLLSCHDPNLASYTRNLTVTWWGMCTVLDASVLKLQQMTYWQVGVM